MVQASVWREVTAHWWRQLHWLLATSRHSCHHSKSLWNSVFRLQRNSWSWREFMRSRIQHRKVRPPYTTLQTQLSLPARCCCYVLLARFLPKNSVMTFQKALSLSAGKESVIYLFIYLAILFNVDSNRKNIVYNKK